MIEALNPAVELRISRLLTTTLRSQQERRHHLTTKGTAQPYMDVNGRIETFMLCLCTVGSSVLVSTLETLAVGQCRTLFRFNSY